MPSGYLGASNTATRNQLDITAPSVTEATRAATAIPTRLGGSSRYQTAVKLAEAKLGTTPGNIMGESDNVVIASGQSFPDALSAGYLAATKNAPILLTGKDTLPDEVEQFLKTYGAKNVYLIGKTGAISQAVQNRLEGLTSYDVQGVSSTETTTRTLNTGTIGANSPSNGVALGSAFTYTDLPAAPAALDVTIVYGTAPTTGTDYTASSVTVPNGYTVQYTAGAGTATVTHTATGQSRQVTFPATKAGTDSDTDGVADVQPADTVGNFTVANTPRSIETTTEVPSDGATAPQSERRVVPLSSKLTVTRIGGDNRFETNRMVNEYAGATSANPVGTTVFEYGQPRRTTAILADGLKPWDALTAGPLVANSDGQNPIPVVLTMGSSLHSEAAKQVNTLDIRHMLLIGGRTVIPDSVATGLNSSNVSYLRLGGGSRWETAADVAEFALRSSTPSAANATPGFGFAAGGMEKSPFLVNGGVPQADKWADALTAGPYAADERRIITITATKNLPNETAAVLGDNAALLSPVTAVGLGDVVSTEVVDAANRLVAN